MKASRTGELAGMRFPDWISLVLESRGKFAVGHWPEVGRLTVQSFLNELMFWEEERQLSTAIEEQIPSDPIIVTGFPRSGTTYLHQLLCQDSRFAFPTTLQVSNPHTFCFVEGRLGGLPARWGLKLYGFWIRLWWGAQDKTWVRQVDRVREGLALPQEDEYALLMMKRSPLLGLTFFRSLHASYAERYTTLPEGEDRLGWQRDWKRFLQKLTLVNQGRPLVCKSHFHLARVGPILELFPGAKFVHIQRDPLEVFRSWSHLLELVRPDLTRHQVLQLFLTLYERHLGAYLQDREMLPPNQRYELRYEDLVSKPLAALGDLYDDLSLPSFELAEPAVKEHLKKTSTHRPSEYPELDQGERQEILSRLELYFQTFGYLG